MSRPETEEQSPPPEPRQRLTAAAAALRDRGLLGAARWASVSLRLREGHLALLTDAAGAPGFAEVAFGAGVRLERDAAAALHALVYANAAEVGAVIVAQPMAAAALGLRGTTIAQCILPLPCAGPLRPAGSDSSEGDREEVDLLAVIGPLVCAAVCGVQLGPYGVVLWGEDLQQASERLAQLEHAARITLAAFGADRAAALSEREVTRWQRAVEQIGWLAGSRTCSCCNACSNGHLARPSDRRESATEQAALEAALDGFFRT